MLFQPVAFQANAEESAPLPHETAVVENLPAALATVSRLVEVRYKDSVDAVRLQVGEPEQSETPRNSIGKSTRWLHLHYGDAGSISFKRYSDKNPKRARVGHVEYRVKENFAKYGDAWLKVVMDSHNPSALSAIAEYLEEISGYSDTGYELLAGRLKRDMQLADGGTANGLSYICLILGADPQGRYVDLLREVEAKAPAKKLKKHAAQALKRFGAE